MNKTITMIRIVAGLGENENIIKASNELNEIDDLEIKSSNQIKQSIGPLILIQKMMKDFQRIMNSSLLL